MRARGIAGLSAALAGLVAALLLATAWATDELSRSDRRGDVKAKGLSAAERRAGDIVKVSGWARPGLAAVHVRFAGDLEKAIGRGGLRRAVAGVVLETRAGKESAIGTAGSAKAPEAAERGVATDSLVLRKGSTFTFLAKGVAGARLRTAQLAISPRRGRRASAALADALLAWLSGHANDQRDGDTFVAGGSGSDGVALPPPSCDELRRSREVIQLRLEEETERRDNSAGRIRRRHQQEVDTIKGWRDSLDRQIAEACRTQTTAPPGGEGGQSCSGGLSIVDGDARFLFRCTRAASAFRVRFSGRRVVRFLEPPGMTCAPAASEGSATNDSLSCTGAFSANSDVGGQARTDPAPDSSTTAELQVDGKAFTLRMGQ